MLDFNALVDNFLKQEFRPKEVGRYYPSEIGMCMRKIWYSYKYPKETANDLAKIFQAGNMMHDFVVEVLKSEKNKEVELVKSELPFQLDQKEFIISGRIDDLVLIKEKRKLILVEVKSCSSLFYINEPKYHNLIQLQLYMYALGIEDGILLYIEKNTLQSKAFRIKQDKNISDEAIKRFELLHSFLKESRLPEAEAKQDAKKGWMCKFCEYSGECSGNER